MQWRLQGYSGKYIPTRLASILLQTLSRFYRILSGEAGSFKGGSVKN
jgi:hypothetical protein